jgi:hypothetical protein
VSYLNCPVCHLSLRAPRASFLAPQHCPRCIGRRHVATPLIPSPLPMRHLAADEAARATPERLPDQPPAEG